MPNLKLRGVEGHLVQKPGAAFIGQAPQYLGWKRNEAGELVPTEFEVDPTSQLGLRLAKLMKRDGSFEPADAETAKLLGMPYGEPKKAKKS
jgi:hypothetical protein